MVYNRLKDLREDKDLTQTYMAKLLHISQRSYSHYETGTRQIPVEILIDLSIFYDVSIEYLLGLTDYKKQPEWDKAGAKRYKELRSRIVNIAR